jgi:hypothetical protein
LDGNGVNRKTRRDINLRGFPGTVFRSSLIGFRMQMTEELHY